MDVECRTKGFDVAGGWVGNLKKIKGIYWCRFKADKKEHHRTTGEALLPKAQKWLADFRESLTAIKEDRAPAPTVQALLDEWERCHPGPDSESHVDRVKRDFRLYLLPEFGSTPADQITAPDILRIRRTFLAGTTDKGRRHTKQGANNMHRHFRLVWRWAIEEKLLTEMPWKIKGLRVQRKPRFTLPADSVDEFLAVIDRARNPHVGISVRAQLYMGLRESESLHLRYEWFTPDFSGYTPGKWIEGEFRSKGGEAVVLPIPPHFQAMLRDTLGDRQAPYVGFVIPAPDGLPHRGQFSRKAVFRAGTKCGVVNLTPHRLRATCATLLARQGVPVTEIQALLRHKHIETTMRYIETNFVATMAAQKILFEPEGTKKGTRRPGGIFKRWILKVLTETERGSHNP